MQSPFAEAAFDLARPVPDIARRGLQNLTAFLSPAQQHVHALLTEAPIAWGQSLQAGVATPSVVPWQLQQASAQFNIPQEAGNTIWLTTTLRGGVKRNGDPGSGDDGDNGTDPTASSSTTPTLKKRSAATLTLAVAARRDSAETPRKTLPA